MSVLISINADNYLPIPENWCHEKKEGYQKHPFYTVLTHLAKGGLPISEKQEGIFKASHLISQKTSKYLSKIGFSLMISAALIGSLSNLPVRTYLKLEANSPWN